MGSATKVAIASLRGFLSTEKNLGTDLMTGTELLFIARSLSSSPQLLGAFAAPSATDESKKTLVTSIFSGKLSPVSLELTHRAVAFDWSDRVDIVSGIENIAVRLIARSVDEGFSSQQFSSQQFSSQQFSAEESVENELFAFSQIVSTHSELELALSSKSASHEDKIRLIAELVTEKYSLQARTLLEHLVSCDNGTKISQRIRLIAELIADECGYSIATVTTAVALTKNQHDQLSSRLENRAGRKVRLNTRIDQRVIGGIRIQLGATVIDSSIATKLNDLRLQLAG